MDILMCIIKHYLDINFLQFVKFAISVVKHVREEIAVETAHLAIRMPQLIEQVLLTTIINVYVILDFITMDII